MDNGLDRSKLSRDTKVIDSYNSDPLVHGQISMKLGMYMLDKGAYIRQNQRNFKTPTLIMYGTGEGIISPAAIESFCQSSQNCSKKSWQGLYHEIHNEPEKIEVLKYVNVWVTSQVIS
jgi:alpha-beta hydrolase superfamily lysophospholipase